MYICTIIPSIPLRHFFPLRGFYQKSSLMVNLLYAIYNYNICYLKLLMFSFDYSSSQLIIANAFFYGLCLHRLIMANAIYYGLLSTYYIKCLLLDLSSTYCIEHLVLNRYQIKVMDHPWNSNQLSLPTPLLQSAISLYQ